MTTKRRKKRRRPQLWTPTAISHFKNLGKKRLGQRWQDALLLHRSRQAAQQAKWSREMWYRDRFQMSRICKLGVGGFDHPPIPPGEYEKREWREPRAGLKTEVLGLRQPDSSGHWKKKAWCLQIESWCYVLEGERVIYWRIDTGGGLKHGIYRAPRGCRFEVTSDWQGGPPVCNLRHKKLGIFMRLSAGLIIRPDLIDQWLRHHREKFNRERKERRQQRLMQRFGRRIRYVHTTF